MKVSITDRRLELDFPKGGRSLVPLDEIESIRLETVPTMTVDVDIVSLNYTNGEFLEVSDDAEGFNETMNQLSDSLGIVPPIPERFPVRDGESPRVYDRK